MTGRVTRVTGLAVVAVTLHFLMVLIRILLIVLMADDAAEDREVVGIGMAVAALIPRVVMRTRVDREPLRVMIELRLIPVDSVVTHLAGRRKSRRGMVWIRSPIVIGLMAEIARGGSSLVLVIHVTGNTIHRKVRTGQRETRAVVVERTPFPAVHIVALQTFVRESGRLMIRIIRVLVVLLMA